MQPRKQKSKFRDPKQRKEQFKEGRNSQEEIPSAAKQAKGVVRRGLRNRNWERDVVGISGRDWEVLKRGNKGVWIWNFAVIVVVISMETGKGFSFTPFCHWVCSALPYSVLQFIRLINCLPILLLLLVGLALVQM